MKVQKRKLFYGLAGTVAAVAVICCASALWKTRDAKPEDNRAAEETTEFVVNYTETVEDHTKIVVQPD